MVEYIKKLESLGLTKNEAKIYLALLKIGSSLAGKLSKETELNRTTTYDVLKGLMDKGLVGYVIESNRKVFKAANPNRLIELIKEKEEDAKEIIPRLNLMYKTPKKEAQVTLYHGKKGIKSVFQDFLREGKPICVMDSEGLFTEKMPYYAPHYTREIERKKIPIKHLVKRGTDLNETKTTQVRFIPKKHSSQSAIDIYGDKVAIVVWTEPPEAVIIKNKAVADSFRHYFDMIWKIAKP